MIINVIPNISKDLEAKEKRDFIYKNIVLFLNKNYIPLNEHTLYCFTCSNLAAYHDLNYAK